MSSRTITSVVTSDTIALNAAVFGYAGHSLVTPHQAIQQIWWTDERIEAKVTRDFITSKLRPNERQQLSQPVFFGQHLTDDTYLDWILRKARRLYLILCECGVSDQIFGVVEDSWDDGDLPISLAEITSLALSYKNDGELNNKFYTNQFKFLLRPLYKYGHIDYASNEVIPIEYIHKLPPAAALQSWPRLHLPKTPNEVYVRRELSLGEKDVIDPVQESQFLTDMDIARSLEHPHIAPVWASWTTRNSGFWVTSFVAEHNLKSFIDFRLAASVQKLTKPQRHAMLLNWLHCLADAVAMLHQRGMHHGAITPSNILIDASNHIAFSDVGSLKSFQKDKKLDPNEVYNYGAPEDHITPKSPTSNPPASTPSRSFFGHRRNKSASERKVSIDSTASGSTISAGSTFSVDSQGTFVSKPMTSPYSPSHSLSRNRSYDTLLPPPPPAKDYPSPRSGSSWNKNRQGALESIPEPLRRAPPPPPLPLLRTNAPKKAQQEKDCRAADIFSLGCIFVDIITYLFKKRITDLIRHRQTKQKNATGKGWHSDASYHGNSGKVIFWTELLEREAKISNDPTLRAIPHVLRLVRGMLSQNPALRPNAETVRSRVFDALVSYGGLTMHCTGTREVELAVPPSPAPTFCSMDSIDSVISKPRIAAFPPIVPSRSPLRRSVTPSMSWSSLSPTSTNGSFPSPPPRTSSRAYSSTWGKPKTSPGWNSFVGVSV
ncbi:hypothetical protein EG328_006942 [Venturia inaequalis]|uniref:Protein kinase domain-containing protein n=1 Tax=Venturia inaequalis TaxID=5025 RepID=A0A8H3UH13_VENIN|nr:hypothetical protein EG328_006942 [Venturia inaequalis]RDI79297.1 hypothetical protein Vi05172_g10732 [Venturia inaequalis]